MSTFTMPSYAPLNRNARKTPPMQTYNLVHAARGKLSSEASRADHNLRRLVGHANLLDSLMLELTKATQEHETWFNEFICEASKPTRQRHIQGAGAIVNEPEEGWRADDANLSDSDGSDSDYCPDEGIKEQTSSIRLATSYNEVEEFEDDSEEDYDDLVLHLTQSHGASPPDLEYDSEDSSDDDLLPPSPPANVLPSFSEKQLQEAAIIEFNLGSPTSPLMTAAEKQDTYNADFVLPQHVGSGPISTINVY
jgi:hypothetical protein